MLLLLPCFFLIISSVGRMSAEETKIVGGSPTVIEKFPYLISLQQFNSHICGGSIISSNYVLTAAHCTYNTPAITLTVRYGSSKHTEGGSVLRVSCAMEHPNYDPVTHDYDAALLKVAPLSLLMKLPDLPRIALGTTEIPDGTLLTVTGWGTLVEGGGISSVLQTVNVPKVPESDCKSAYAPLSKFSNNIE